MKAEKKYFLQCLDSIIISSYEFDDDFLKMHQYKPVYMTQVIH